MIDKATGIFTAPNTVLYFFSAHVCYPRGQFMVISIIHEGIAVATTTEHESNRDSCSSVSAPAMVKVAGKCLSSLPLNPARCTQTNISDGHHLLYYFCMYLTICPFS
jgi:hypothetical protein